MREIAPLDALLLASAWKNGILEISKKKSECCKNFVKCPQPLFIHKLVHLFHIHQLALLKTASIAFTFYGAVRSF